MRRRQQRRHTEEQIAEALAVLTANGGNLRGTANQLGIPHTTLLQWQKQQKTGRNRAGHAVDLCVEVVELRTRKRNDMALAIEDIVWKCITRLSESVVLDKTGRPTDLSTVMGVGIDKMRLLFCESTAITETKDRHPGEE